MDWGRADFARGGSSPRQGVNEMAINKPNKPASGQKPGAQQPSSVKAAPSKGGKPAGPKK